MSDAQTPVSGLGTADFVLRDAGTRIGVLSAVPAVGPLFVAVVVTGFEAAELPDVRRGLDDLTQAVLAREPGSRIGVMTGDAAAGWHLAMLGAPAAGARPQVQSGGGDLIGGILAACTALGDAPADRRTILAVVHRPTQDASSAAASRLQQAVIDAHAALWTIEVASSDPAMPPGLDRALTDATQASGSIRSRAASGADVPAAAARVAQLWLTQYLVTYTWPEPMVSQFSLVTRHDAGTVLTPVWTR